MNTASSTQQVFHPKSGREQPVRIENEQVISPNEQPAEVEAMNVNSHTSSISKRGRKSKATTAQILEESTNVAIASGSSITNRGHKRKAITIENTDERVTEQETSKYLGYDVLISYLNDQEKWSYRGFLVHHRDIIIASTSSDNWHDLDNTWAGRFLEEAEKLLIDKRNFMDLTKKVKLERDGNGLQTYWKGVIKEHNKENLPTSTKSGKKEKKQRQVVKTELELLSTIPPPIYYPNLNKSITTTKSTTARTPSPVKLWDLFIEKVQSHQFDDSVKQYSQPSFKTYDKSYDISNEEDVRGAIKNNILDNLHIITTSQQPIEIFKRISKEDNVTGKPDFIYKQVDKLLLLIEVKTLWVLYLEDDKPLHERYKEDLERKKSEIIPSDSGSKISVVDILCQIFGYLVVNQLQYGILTTYNQHWFLQRPKNEPRALYISPTIDVKSRNPSIFQCYAYIQHLSRIDAKCPSPGVTPPSSPPPSFDDNESSDNNTLDSDYEETLKKSKQKRKQNSQASKKNSTKKAD